MKTRRSGCGRYPLCCFNALTASHLRVGVSHSSRSTPAVRLPWFSVTRRTASDLAANERISDRCSAFTLRQSLSCVAFAIRICIVLTCISTRRHSMDCQPFDTCEDAEPSLSMISSMLTSLVNPSRTRTSPRREACVPSGPGGTQQPARDGCTTWKWARFRSGANLEPLSQRLQPGVRFFHDPIPPRPTGRLAASLPMRRSAQADGGAYHVPQTADSAVLIRDAYPFRVCLSRGCAHDDVLSFATRTTGSVPFGCGLTAGLATQSLPGFNRQFTYVTHAELAWPLVRHPAGRVRAHPRGIHTPPGWETLSDGLHTGPLPVLHAIVGYRWSRNGSRP